MPYSIFMSMLPTPSSKSSCYSFYSLFILIILLLLLIHLHLVLLLLLLLVLLKLGLFFCFSLHCFTLIRTLSSTAHSLLLCSQLLSIQLSSYPSPSPSSSLPPFLHLSLSFSLPLFTAPHNASSLYSFLLRCTRISFIQFNSTPHLFHGGERVWRYPWRRSDLIIITSY